MKVCLAESVCVSLAMCSSILLSYVPARDPAGEYATAQKRPLERSFAVDSAAAEAGSFAHRVEAGHRLAVTRAQHAALQVGLDSSQAFPRQDELTDRDQRPSCRVEDPLEVTSADPVAAIGAEIRDAPQLVVVVIYRPARDHLIPTPDGGGHGRAVKP